MERIKDEEKAGGISPEVSELDRLLEEIIEEESLVDSSREGESIIRKNEQNRKAAEDMRKTAMERMGETRKRSTESEGGDISVKRKQRGGSDAVDYLRERAKKEIKIREEELALKKEKQDQEASKQSLLLQQQGEMLNAMKERQSQMQNIQAMMLQQQHHPLGRGGVGGKGRGLGIPYPYNFFFEYPVSLNCMVKFHVEYPNISFAISCLPMIFPQIPRISKTPNGAATLILITGSHRTVQVIN